MPLETFRLSEHVQVRTVPREQLDPARLEAGQEAAAVNLLTICCLMTFVCLALGRPDKMP